MGRKLKPAVVVQITRGDRNIAWIERNCCIPEGKFVGKPVRLTKQQKGWIRRIYDSPTRLFILSMARKNAKALALDTPIPTPNGWRVMRDIQAGDFVFGADGQPTRVLIDSEVFVDKRCYRVEFSDGSHIVASEDHLWTTRHKFRPWEVAATYSSGKLRGKPGQSNRDPVEGEVTTAQIAESLLVPRTGGRVERNHRIELGAGLRSEATTLPIDPYLLGAWLGDGTSLSATFTSGERDLEHLTEQLVAAGEGDVTLYRPINRAATLRVGAKGKGHPVVLASKLRTLGVIGSKHIPPEYFNAGTAQRWALFQGLMDTDGTVNRCGSGTPRCSFSNTSEALAYDVWRLARTLGLKAKVITGDAMLNGRRVSAHYRVEFPASKDWPVFRMQRKQALLPETLGARTRSLQIIACTEVESVPCKCIAVEAEDHLFLAGHGCVPTHNTSFSAFLLLLHLCGPEALPNSQLFSAAQSRDQAAVLFALAAKMVRMSPELSQYVVIRDTAKQLFCGELGTLYRALSADASTAFGLSPAFTVHDELGQVKGPTSELYEALETASAAQETPLSIVISTQAPTDGDLLSILIDDGLSGADPHVKVELCTAPLEMDPFSEEAIRAANPHFDDFMNKDEVFKQAAIAKRMPSREASYRNLILNQRIEMRNPFVSKHVWQENSAPQVSDDLSKCDVYAGLDLSSVSDLTALVLISHVDGAWDVHPTFWLPAVGLEEKSRNDREPYDVWAKQGFLETTPGSSIEYEFIAEHLRGIFDRCNVKALAFDRYNMRFLKPWLEKAGFTEKELERFIDFGQGFVSMSPALRELESLLLSRKLRHASHPVLQMCARNATVVMDPAENRKFVKGKTTGRIDGMVALAMAVGVRPSEPEPPKQRKYQMFTLGR